MWKHLLVINMMLVFWKKLCRYAGPKLDPDILIPGPSNGHHHDTWLSVPTNGHHSQLIGLRVLGQELPVGCWVLEMDWSGYGLPEPGLGWVRHQYVVLCYFFLNKCIITCKFLFHQLRLMDKHNILSIM